MSEWTWDDNRLFRNGEYVAVLEAKNGNDCYCREVVNDAARAEKAERERDKARAALRKIAACERDGVECARLAWETLEADDE